MRPLVKYVTKFAVATAAVTASAPATAADFYLKLGPVKSEQGNAKVREAAARAAVTSWSWGASQNRDIKKIKTELYVEQRVGQSAAPAANPAAADFEGDGRADRNVKPPRDSTSGHATGKRMHKPPIVHGVITLTGSFPSCSVGAAYEGAVLQVSGAPYQFEDVVITDCAPAGGIGGTPAQSLTMSYVKRKLN